MAPFVGKCCDESFAENQTEVATGPLSMLRYIPVRTSSFSYFIFRKRKKDIIQITGISSVESWRPPYINRILLLV